jgi:DTW domain-containing protein YfiP
MEGHVAHLRQECHNSKCVIIQEKLLKVSMCATTIQLHSSFEFFLLRFDTVPVKSASANVSFSTITQKCKTLSCDTLVANERYVSPNKR